MSGELNKKLLAIVILAAALRLWLVFTAEGVNSDAFKYARTVERIAQEGVAGGLKGDHFWPYFPVNRQLIFYPLLGSLVNCAVGDVILSLRLVSALAGIGLVAAGFTVARELTDSEPIALLTAGLLALHPEFARASAAVYREVTMAFLLVLALMFLLWALRRERKWPTWALLTGLTLFCAFLTRPDGAVGAAALGVAALFFATEVPWRRRLAVCLLMGALFVALEAPYVLWMKKQTGYWMVNQWQIQNKLRPPEAARRHLLGGEEAPVEPRR